MTKFVVVVVLIHSLAIALGQPAVDECVSVNASTPVECPEHIGPPCPPCFTNDRPDYTAGDSLSLQDKTTQQLLSSRLNYWINYWLDHYPPNSTYPLSSQRSNSMISDSFILAHSTRDHTRVDTRDSYTLGSGSSTQFNIFTGSAGRGQIFLRLYRYTNNETYLHVANEYINHALSLLPKTESNPSYLEGHIGVYAIKLLYETTVKNVNQSAVEYYQNKILNVFESVDNYIVAFYNPSINNGSFANAKNNDKLPSVAYDMYCGGNDLGLGGLIYTGLFINNYYGSIIVDKGYFANLTYYLIDLGIYNGVNLYSLRNVNGTALFGFNKTVNEVPLMYEVPFLKGCYIYGMGHGNGGVLKWIFEAISNYFPEFLQNTTSNVENNKILKYVTNTLEYFTEIQLADGNMPTAVYGNCSNNWGTDNDARVQWCHGAPGFIDVFSEASYLYQKLVQNDSLAEKWFNASLKTADTVWNRGLLVKGSMIGHGITGNSYMLALLNKNIQNLQALPSYSSNDLEFIGNQSQWRSNQFIEWTLDVYNMEATRCVYSDASESMWAGCPGIAMIYVQAMQTNWPDVDVVCVPAWNYCI